MRSKWIPYTLSRCELPPWPASPAFMLLVLFLFSSSSALGADESDFSYEPEGVGARVSRYRGTKAAVVIPEQLGGLPVISIGDYVFYDRSDLTSVTIPNSVTNIGSDAFAYCQGLTNINIPSGVTSIGALAFFYCEGLTSITIPTGVTTIESSTFAFCTGLTNVTIPNSVSAIGIAAFYGCGSLTSVTIPNSITRIERRAFSFCWGLTGVYFQGPPSADLGSEVFEGSEVATVYYLRGSGGWSPTFGGRPTALWLPSIRTTAASFGVHDNEFGFDVSWAPGMTVVVEAATHLTSPAWFPLQTLTLPNDSTHFIDPQWTSQAVRFYRLRIP